MKKRILSILISLVLCLSLGTSVLAAESVFDPSVTINRETEGKIIVTVKADDSILGAMLPTLSVPCSYNYVQVTGPDGTVDASIADDMVSFKVTKAGTYTITDQGEYFAPVYYEPIYRVTVESDDNDIIISNRIWAYGYNTVTLTVTPDEGYVLQSLTVTDGRGNKVEVTDNGDGKYTFKMPCSNVIVDAICVYDLPFTDVTPEDDYFDAVSFLHQQGLVNGMGNDLYQPETSFTRAMIATMLHRLAELPAYNVASDLSDVDADTWYTGAVYWGTEAGLITGYPDGSFAPNVDISVRELVVLLYRYAQYAENPDCDKTGWSGATWADAGLAWAEANDILPEGEDLNAPASRALAAQVIYNVYNLLEN